MHMWKRAHWKNKQVENRNSQHRKDGTGITSPPKANISPLPITFHRLHVVIGELSAGYGTFLFPFVYKLSVALLSCFNNIVE